MYHIAAAGIPILEQNEFINANEAHKLTMIFSLLIIDIVFKISC